MSNFINQHRVQATKFCTFRTVSNASCDVSFKKVKASKFDSFIHKMAVVSQISPFLLSNIATWVN